MENMILKAPIKVNPYEHQAKAFKFAMSLCGVVEGGDASSPLKRSGSCALLMEM